VCQNLRQWEFVFAFFAVFESVQKMMKKWAHISKTSGVIFLKFGIWAHICQRWRAFSYQKFLDFIRQWSYGCVDIALSNILMM